jgi:putative exosortase-associated protein (TIGR04073 family)
MHPLKPLSIVVGVALLLTGCASAEKKLGRGISNAFEPFRMGEFSRSYEQTYLYEGPDVASTRGVIQGVNRTIGRTAVGLFEIVTFPIPSDPYFKPANPVYPDSYTPHASDNSAISTDARLGFDGGDSAAFIPGSRFTVFGE